MENTIQFANELASEGFLKEAIIEYRRALYFYPEAKEDQTIYRTLFYYGLISNQYRNVLDVSRKWSQDPIRTEEVRDLCTLYEGISLYKLESYSRAVETFESLSKKSTATLNHRALYWGGLSLLRQNYWDRALAKFNAIPQNSEITLITESAESAVLTLRNFKPKKPLAAGVLSVIIPGLGYYYSGSPQTFIAASVTNGLLIWATLSSYNKEMRGTTVLLSLFTVSWYFGGVYGSAVSSLNYNKRFYNKVFLNLESY